MLRLVEADEVGLPMGHRMGEVLVDMGGQILIDATSADKPRFLECRNVTATAGASSVPVPDAVEVMKHPRASCDGEDSNEMRSASAGRACREPVLPWCNNLVCRWFLGQIRVLESLLG